jgi:hypothetical protein
VTAESRAEVLFSRPVAAECEMLKSIYPAAADAGRRLGEVLAAWSPYRDQVNALIRGGKP